MNEGEVAIKATLNPTPLEKKLKNLKNRLKNEEVNLEIKAEKTEDLLSELAEAKNKLQDLKQERKEINKEYDKMFSKWDSYEQRRKAGDSFTLDEYGRYESLENHTKELYADQIRINEEISQQEKLVAKINSKYDVAEKSLEKQDNKINEIKQDITETEGAIVQANKETEKANFDKIKQGISDVKNESENIIKKVAKWGLAIFSIRSAYMLVRQAVSSLSQYNEQIGTDIQYIRFALASMLQPVIEAIIKLVYKLLAYIGYIAKAWFGVNLFANASAKAFQKVNKGVKDTNKEAKKLQKTLAGFDEMNVLQENGSVGTGGGGGGISLPTNDLSDLMKDVDVPDWIKWIADNGELVKNIIIGIGVAIAGLKLAQLLLQLSGFGKTFLEMFTGLSKIGQLAQAGFIVGIAVALVGIYNTIKSVIAFIKDPSWSNFFGILNSLSTALMGVGAALVFLNSSNPLGWITLGIGIAGKYISAIAEIITKNEETTRTTMSVYDAEKKLNDARDKRVDSAKRYAQAIKNEEDAEKKLNDIQKKNKVSGKALHDEILNGTRTYKDLLPKEREVYDAYLNHLEAKSELTKATKEQNDALIEERKARTQMNASIYASTQTYSEYYQTLIDGYEKTGEGAKKLTDATLGMLEDMDVKTRETFKQNLPESVRNAFKEVKDTSFAGWKDVKNAFKDGSEQSYNEIINGGERGKKALEKFFSNAKSIIKQPLQIKMETKLNTSSAEAAFKKLINNMSSNSWFGKIVKKAVGMKTGGILQLASGAVINQPGRGVPLTSNVVGGEAGREGIIPLTDQRAMAQLGYEIGRYITVNAQMNNYMNGRLISKELQTIQNQEDFAFNR